MFRHSFIYVSVWLLLCRFATVFLNRNKSTINKRGDWKVGWILLGLYSTTSLDTYHILKIIKNQYDDIDQRYTKHYMRTHKHNDKSKELSTKADHWLVWLSVNQQSKKLGSSYWPKDNQMLGGGQKGKRMINICLVESNPALKCCWTARYHRRLTRCDEGGKMKKQEVGKSKQEPENHQKLIEKRNVKKCKGKPRIFHHVHLERETTMHQSIPPADGAIEILWP